MQDSRPVPDSLDDAWLTPDCAFPLNRRDLVRTSFAGAVGAALAAAAGLSASAAAAQPGGPAFPGSPGFPFPTPCPQALSVKDFGAVGNGQAIDGPAIQAAIDAAPSNGGTICFPPGTYRITEPLRIHDDHVFSGQPGTGRRGLRLVGSLAGASGFVNCTILWDAPAAIGPSMLQVFSRDCVVERLAFHVGRGRVLVVIDVDKNPDSAAVCSNNTFHNVQIRRAEGIDSPGTFDYGVRISEEARSNAESMQFTKCLIMDASRACVRIGESHNSKDHTFLDCFFLNAPVGIWAQGGSWQTYSCTFLGLATAIRLHKPIDNLLIVDSDAENCMRFIDTFEANLSNFFPVSIIGGRFENGPETIVTEPYIVFHYGGPLVILNSLFNMLGSPPVKIEAGAPGPGTVLVSIGNVFSVGPGESPYVDLANQRRISVGNKRAYAADSTGLFTYIDDEIVNIGVNPDQGAISLGTVRAISATGTLSRNLRGSITITGTDTSAVVIFDVPEPDLAYFVSAVVAGVTGTVAPGSTRVYINGKAADSFQVNLESAPGADNSVTVDWILIR